MKLAFKILTVGLTAWCFSGLITDAVACTTFPPMDYTEITRNQKFILVQFADAIYFFGADFELRRKYRYAGLYPNNGSSVPLWTINWYADGNVYPVSDGIHLVKVNYSPRPEEETAVSFYRRGKLLKSYKFLDLVNEVSHLTSDSMCSRIDWIDKLEYREDKGFLYIKTKDGIQYRFSIYSGEVFPPVNTR
ncbi:MAG: hypothetical protein ACAI44_18515 [Candidatus Sericytochromatia bacterium]